MRVGKYVVCFAIYTLWWIKRCDNGTEEHNIISYALFSCCDAVVRFGYKCYNCSVVSLFFCRNSLDTHTHIAQHRGMEFSVCLSRNIADVFDGVYVMFLGIGKTHKVLFV